MSPGDWIIWGGLGIGLAYGATAQVSGFCLNSALRNQVRDRQGDKLRAFILACVIALIGTHWVAHMGLVNINESIYATKRVSWPLIVSGGLLFGFGMILSRGCGARSLVLLGQGNLRSLVVLLCLGISAYATLTGILGPWRTWVATATTALRTWTPAPPMESEAGRTGTEMVPEHPPGAVSSPVPVSCITSATTAWATIKLKSARWGWKQWLE